MSPVLSLGSPCHAETQQGAEWREGEGEQIEKCGLAIEGTAKEA